jgi:hypothetical protein
MVQVRAARRADADGVAGLAGELAQSFPFSREGFDRSYPDLLADEHACLLVAEDGDGCAGYVHQESAVYLRKVLPTSAAR